MMFIVVVLMFPAAPAPSAQSMNYTVVVLGGWLLLSLAFYYMPVIGGVHWFNGPITNAGNRMSSNDNQSEKDSDLSGDVGVAR